MSRIPMLVVGGGVGGLACALALARSGRRVHVLEAAPRFGEIGAGIQLAPNATRVLRELGVIEALLPLAVLPRELVYMDALANERITSVDLGPAFLERYGDPYMVIHRSDLHQVLLDACVAEDRVSLETNREVVAVQELADGVRVRCAQGSSYEAPALIGADGLRSVVRPLVIQDTPTASEYVAYRGTIRFSEVTPHAGVDSVVMWVAPDLHLVQYKVRGGELYNQVGVFRSYRYQEGEDWGTPEELDEHFAACCEPVRYGASLLGRQMRWPMYDREPIPNWTQGPITLIGDAAHPMLQYIAQGGCQAIEDSICLAHSITSHPDPHDAFIAYQTQRIPHTAQVQHTARTFGEICHLHGIAITLRNTLFAQHHPQDYEPLDWLYGTHHHERQTAAASAASTQL